MTILRLLCFFGLHPRKGWLFVGSSWDPDSYVHICVECRKDV